MWGVKIARLAERIDGLRDLMDARFVTHRTLLESQASVAKLALEAADKAVTKSEVSVNDRLSAMNEFRGALADASANNVTRAEFEQFRQTYAEQHVILRDQLAKEIADLKGRMDRSEGRSGGFSGAWGIIVAVAGIAVAVGALVFRNM